MNRLIISHTVVDEMREALASNLPGYRNTRDFGPPSPGPANLALTPLIQPNTGSDAPGGVDKRGELDSNGPTSTAPDGPNARSFSPPSAPDEPDSPNSLNFCKKRAELDSNGPSTPQGPNSREGTSNPARSYYRRHRFRTWRSTWP
ncbi:hypothetical protein BDR03DRAFT_226437 [Suillus americanus]|nr:hypothetical protein BDR03DRAFT_226437 [Suillus americanus]